MPPIAATPLFMREAVLELDFADVVDYACHVSSAAVVPEPGKAVTFTPLCPDGAVTEFGADEFTLELEGAQDWTATGLARLLWQHAGELIPFRLNAFGGASSPATPSITGVVRAVRPAYGGAAEEYAELDIELPIIGIPELVTA